MLRPSVSQLKSEYNLSLPSVRSKKGVREDALLFTAVVSMGRRNTKVEVCLDCIQRQSRSRALNRTEHYPGQVLIEWSPTDRLSMGKARLIN